MAISEGFSIKDRYVPYRILVFLLYASTDYIEHLPDGYIKVKTGPMARHMNYNYSYVKTQLKWLLERGLLDDLVLDTGLALVKLKSPRLNTYD